MSRIERIGDAGRATRFGEVARAWCYRCHHEHLRGQPCLRFNPVRVPPTLRTCPNCEGSFEPGVGGRRTYCSVVCWSEARAAVRRRKAAEAREAVMAG